MCRHIFYTVPSRLIGHRLHLRIYDDRIEAYLGGRFLLTVPRGRRAKGVPPVHVVGYDHIIAARRAKPGALANLPYRDALRPRTAYRRMGGAQPRRVPHAMPRAPWSGSWLWRMSRREVPISPCARCATLKAGELPKLAAMLRQFTPTTVAAPDVSVILPSLAAYDRLIAPAGAEVTP